MTLLLFAGASAAPAQEWNRGHASPEPVAPVQHAAPKPVQAERKNEAAKTKSDTKPEEKKAALKPKANDKGNEKVAAKPKPDEKAAAKSAKKDAKNDDKTPEPARKPDLAKAAAKVVPKIASVSHALAGLPRDEQFKIQAALSWAGDFAAPEKGEDPLTTAIKNFQKRVNAPVTGTLTDAQRDRLLAAARDHEDEFGWSVVTDPATGIRIGLPTKLVPYARDAARGTRWSSPHGEVQIETFRIKDAGLKLATLFEQEKTDHGRQVEASVLHDDNFFVSGIQGLKKFAVRAAIRDGEIRGYTMLFDQMMETIVAPVMVAMASAFAPFPERSAPFAALAKPVEYGSGLVVSAQGHVVTALRMTAGCQVLVVPGLGDAELIAQDKTNDLALLRVYGERKLTAAPLAPAATKPGDVTLVGVPDPREQDGKRKLIELKARLDDNAAIELREPTPVAGLEGAAALDAQGRVLGMMDMSNAVLASNGPAPAAPVRLISAGTIRDFLATHKVAAATASNGDARVSIVRVICVRK